MSRVGNKPIDVPLDVTVTIYETELEVEGPKGTLKTPIPKGVEFIQKGSVLSAKRSSDDFAAMHGLARALANNAIVGVTKGFSKQMDVVGVGYKVDVKGNQLVFALGYSHPVEYNLPDGIEVVSEKLNAKSHIKQYQATLTLSGIDKQLLGQVAAELARLRKSDAYKGKGIRYADRHYKLKQGKAAV